MNSRVEEPRSPGRFTSGPTFRTNTFHFAVWLLVENLLQFERCVAAGGNRVTFVFEDPTNRGAELLSQWLNSDPMIPQKAAVEIARMLRGEMSAVQNLGGVR